MGQVKPKHIIERHENYPDATETLIKAYGFAEYKKAVSDLLNVGKVVEVENSDTALIVLTKEDLKQWKGYERSHWYLNQEIKRV